MFSSRLYQSAPIWVQEVAIALRAAGRNRMRQGHRFRVWLAEIERTQWYSVDELRRYQVDRLRSFLRHAQEFVPYYQDLLRGVGGDLSTFELGDLNRLPYLTKRNAAKAGKALLSKNFHGLRIKGMTGGSTGMSLSGYRNLDALSRENAFLWRQWSWAGIGVNDRRAWIRGDMIVPVARTESSFWRHNRVDHMLMMSSYHLSEQNCEAYIRALEEFDPVAIHAYPSSIAFLARYLDASGKSYKGVSLRSVVTSSETLTQEQRTVILKSFDCAIYDYYGSFERVAYIGTCERGNYHLSSDYSYVELEPQGDGTAEIVGTGFHDILMPLVRYKTGDSVVPEQPDFRCACGRSFPVVKEIIGRLDDFIKFPDGRRLGAAGIIFDGLKNIWEGQIVQDRLDEIRILVVPRGALSASDVQKIETKAKTVIGDSLRIHVEPVKEIVRTGRGKLRMVKCNV